MACTHQCNLASAGEWTRKWQRENRSPSLSRRCYVRTHTHRLKRLTVLHKQRIVLVMFGSNSVRKQEARSLVAIVVQAAVPSALFRHSGFWKTCKKCCFILCRWFALTLWLICRFIWIHNSTGWLFHFWIVFINHFAWLYLSLFWSQCVFNACLLEQLLYLWLNPCDSAPKARIPEVFFFLFRPQCLTETNKNKNFLCDFFFYVILKNHAKKWKAGTPPESAATR